MEPVVIKPLNHRGKECIGIFFKRDEMLQLLLKHSFGARWSNSRSCWYIDADISAFRRLLDLLSGRFNIVADELAAWSAQKDTRNFQELRESPPKTKQRPSRKLLPFPSLEIRKQPFVQNIPALENFKQILVLKGYSPSTIRTYTNEFLQFLNILGHVPVESMTEQRVKDYLHYCYSVLHLSENTLHSRINALKFYYEQVLQREKFFWSIPRPKKHLILPKVLGEEELRRLFEAAGNLKHKAILFAAYSAGLRVSEVINLRIEDIDRERMQLFVYCSKGKKDRYVSLSPLLLDVLERYYRMWKPSPVVYLFEGEEKGLPYSARSAQKIFSDAKKKAGISKSISFHGLRHSFATHMLEKGVDVKYIKEISGHFNIQTTERYLHVKRETLVSIASPLDDLYRKL